MKFLKQIFPIVIFAILLAKVSAVAYAAADYTASAQFGAFAPNAGGQEVYSLKLAHDVHEVGGFLNQYVTAGGAPLIGAVYEHRFAICDAKCWWQFYAQAGGGVSTAGPIGQITWSSQLPLVPLWLPFAAPKYVPAIRIDFTSQFIFTTKRVISWSYPLWVGVSIGF